MRFVVSYGTLDIVIIYIYYTRNNFSMAFPNIVAGPSHEKIREETLISNGRVKGLQIVKPVVYGSVSQALPVKRNDGRTHRWTVYLKPYYNEDFSIYIKKVHFKLHESYLNCSRTISKIPFEVSETGWGEFEVVIKIYFQDPNERPVTIYHILKLFHSGPNAHDPNIINTPVIKEGYDEIVFQDPTILMRNLLTREIPPYTTDEWKHTIDFEKSKIETSEKFSAARTKIQEQLEEQKTKLKLAQETLLRCKEEVTKIKKNNPTSYLSANY